MGRMGGLETKFPGRKVGMRRWWLHASLKSYICEDLWATLESLEHCLCSVTRHESWVKSEKERSGLVLQYPPLTAGRRNQDIRLRCLRDLRFKISGSSSGLGLQCRFLLTAGTVLQGKAGGGSQRSRGSAEGCGVLHSRAPLGS